MHHGRNKRIEPAEVEEIPAASPKSGRVRADGVCWLEFFQKNVWVFGPRMCWDESDEYRYALWLFENANPMGLVS